MTIKMKEEQILKIDPDRGRQAAVIGTPGTCNRAQVVQKQKNRLQPNLYIPGQSYRPVHLRTMTPDKVL
jgi:glutamine cyclotransferase